MPPLSDAQMQALRDAAAREGVDAEELIRAAEAQAQGEGDDGEQQPKHPLAERLLIGFLPFIRVRELRSIWLGLDERIPDDNLTCGVFAAKYGGDAGGGGDE